MRISRKQAQFLKARHSRINILEGAVRSGKTHVLFIKTNHLVHYGPEGKGAIIAKTLETLRENILDPMKAMLGASMNYSDAGRRIDIAGQRIRGVGANDEKSAGKIQGDTLAWAVGDEVTLWPESFFKMLLTRLSVPGASFFGSCNPDSPFHWLKTGFIDRQGKIDLSVFHFGIDDNPFLDGDYVENLKRECTGLWRERFIDGRWVLAEGTVYDMFDASRHVRKATGAGKRIVGVDYGTNNPTVFADCRVDGERMEVVREYYHDSVKEGRQKTDSEYADDMADFIGEDFPSVIYVDPSAASFQLELKRRLAKRGVKIADAKNDVLPGIRHVSRMLSEDRLTVDPSCVNAQQEFGSYVWDSKAQQRGEDRPMKSNDHAMDAIRYAAYSELGGKRYRARKQRYI